MRVIIYTYESIYVGMWMCECDVCVYMCVHLCVCVVLACTCIMFASACVHVSICRMCEYVRESYVDVCVVFM